MTQIIVDIPKVLALIPSPDQGDVVANPKPAPRINKISDNPAAAAAPAGCPLLEETVTVTRHEGYDVEYRYRGEVFVSRLDHDPGDRLRIRVAVIPAADGPSSGNDGWQTANPTY